jgi:hypothetical protein
MEMSFVYRCRVPVSFVPDVMKMGLLGDTFLRNFYSSYNFENDTVSFGVNAANPWSSTIKVHGETSKKVTKPHVTGPVFPVA